MTAYDSMGKWKQDACDLWWEQALFEHGFYRIHASEPKRLQGIRKAEQTSWFQPKQINQQNNEQSEHSSAFHDSKQVVCWAPHKSIFVKKTLILTSFIHDQAAQNTPQRRL